MLGLVFFPTRRWSAADPPPQRLCGVRSGDERWPDFKSAGYPRQVRGAILIECWAGLMIWCDKQGEELSMPKGIAIACAAVGMSTALLIAFAMITTTSQPAMANAAIAKKTGQACAKCHSAPPALNAYGKKYKEGKK